MAVARAKGRLKGRQPTLTAKQQKELRRMHSTGDYTITDLAELFKMSRPTDLSAACAERDAGALPGARGDDLGGRRG